jgi:hypothetical protein
LARHAKMRDVETSSLGLAAVIAPFVVSSFNRTVVINALSPLCNIPKHPLTSLRTGGAGALYAAVAADKRTQMPATVAAEGLRKAGRHGDFVFSAVSSLCREYKRDRLALLIDWTSRAKSSGGDAASGAASSICAWLPTAS